MATPTTAEAVIHQIESAFASRQRPAVVSNRPKDDSDYEDAVAFKNRDWRDITWDDWEDHFPAFFAFTSEAFPYYLPSILTLSISAPDRVLLVAMDLELLLADGLSPTNTPFLRSRLGQLSEQEHEAVAAWLNWMAVHHAEVLPGAREREFAVLECLRASGTD
jgi:hypothetical protein